MAAAVSILLFVVAGVVAGDADPSSSSSAAKDDKTPAAPARKLLQLHTSKTLATSTVADDELLT